MASPLSSVHLGDRLSDTLEARLRVPLYPSELQVASTAAVTAVAVTGATSFLGCALIKRLLAAGFTVHGTARKPADQARVGHLLALPGASERLFLFQADLLSQGSFDPAFQGCRYVIHVATPVAVKVPAGRGRELVIEPAVRGVENVLGAVERSGSVEGVVMTSSLVAVIGGPGLHDRAHVFTHQDWNTTDPEAVERHFPYARAKVEAERRAWQLAGEQQPTAAGRPWRLAVVSPGFITGPPDILFDSELMRGFARLLGGRLGRWTFPVGLPVVDVDDCAAVHVLAMLGPQASGRYLCAAGSPLMIDTFKEAAALYPGAMSLCSPPTRALPRWLAWLACWLAGLWPEMVGPMYGRQLLVDCEPARRELGAAFMAPSRSVADMAARLLELGAVQPRRAWRLGLCGLGERRAVWPADAGGPSSGTPPTAAESV